MNRSSLWLLAVVLCVTGCSREKSTQELAALATAADEPARLHAVRALSAGPKEAPVVVPALTEALKDQNYYVRRDAARALRSYGADAKPAVPALLTAAKDREASVRRAAVNALKEIDPETAAKKLRVR
jgi:HEAT repeat protein